MTDRRAQQLLERSRRLKLAGLIVGIFLMAVGTIELYQFIVQKLFN